MDNNNLLNNKLSKIGPNQTFILILLFFMGYGGYSSYDKHQDGIIAKTRYSETVDKSDKIINLLSQMVDNKVNLVSKQGALNIYEKTFSASSCMILDKVMHTLSINHVMDYGRQKQIRKYYTQSLYNMYMDDKQRLSMYKYRNKRLDLYMVDIDPNEIVDDVLAIMFSDIDTYQKRLDIRSYLYTKFDTLYNDTNTYLEDNG